MIDIHCHILPGLDDGAADMDEALLMARIALHSGTGTVIATPHFGGPGDPASPDVILAAVERLQQALKAWRLPLTVKPGMELLCTDRLEQILDDGAYLTLAGSRYLLTEFYFDEPAEIINSYLRRITLRGLVPVIAHPERYKAVQNDVYLAQYWMQQGYGLQLNAGSLLGELGYSARQTARLLAHRGLAHVVASDGHSPDRRAPRLEQARDYLEERVCIACAQDLLYDGPRMILENKEI